jgi:septum formation protein
MPSPSFPFVYLASQSPRRQELLQQLDVRFELLLPRPDEDAEALEAELPGEAADTYVLRVCAAKAQAAYARRLHGAHRVAPILVAGKPDNADHAVDMLERLSGRDHEVLTAIAVVGADGVLLTPVLSRSLVRFAAVGRAALQRYAATGEPLGKAGAYGVQGRAAAFIERIEGSYSGIMGLPLFETAALLRVARVDF